MNEIVWVGVGFDPAEERATDRELAELHHAISEWCVGQEKSKGNLPTITRFRSGAILEEYRMPAHLVVNICDATDSRIGFGWLVTDVEHGKALLPEASVWLRERGVTVPVSVHAWSPA